MLEYALIPTLAPLFYQVVSMSFTATLLGGVLLLLRGLTDRILTPKGSLTLWCLMVFLLVTPYRLPISGGSFLLRGEENFQLTDIEFPPSFERVIGETTLPQGYFISFQTFFLEGFLPLVWVVGMVGIALYRLGGLLYLHKELRESQEVTSPTVIAQLEGCKTELNIVKPIRILTQNYIQTPALMGVFRPTILLPIYAETLEGEGLRHVLLHELIHYKRKDLWLFTLLSGLKTVYWFNPLVKVLLDCLMEEIEHSTDQGVLTLLEGEKKAYATTLIEVLRQCSSPPSFMGMAGATNHRKRRFCRMKGKKIGGILPSLTCLALIILLGGAFLTTSTAQDSPQTPTLGGIPTQQEIQTNGYPTNGAGETYGPQGRDMLESPDLLLATNEDGLVGYIRLSEDPGAQVTTPEEAMAYMAYRESEEYELTYTMYLEDGETVIGVFRGG